MKNHKILGLLAVSLFAVHFAYAAQAEWSFLTYIQGDNSLNDYAIGNIQAMQLVASTPPLTGAKLPSTSTLNVLVQWDKKQDNGTYRYKLLPQNFVEQMNINKEMGYRPAQEIVDSMTWIKNSYPAKRYALVLWDHGNGVLDRSGKRSLFSWLRAPGITEGSLHSRGLLYDDSQNTFLPVGDPAFFASGTLPVSAGLGQTCARVKSTIGKNIDILGMDACLMAMIEVAYQVKDSVNYMVASQQTEPGIGWEYTASLRAFAGNPTAPTPTLASAIVAAYRDLYSSGDNADSSFTLAAIDVSKIKIAASSFNDVLTKIFAAYGINNVNKTLINTTVKAARANTTSFYIPDYVDLINLYDNLSTQFATLAASRNRSHKSRLPRDAKMQQAATDIINAIAIAKANAQAAIVASQCGADYSGTANGLSIYFPTSAPIDSQYKKTAFALATPQWLTMLGNLLR